MIFSYDVESLYPGIHVNSNTVLSMATLLSPRKGYKEEWVVDIPWAKRQEIIAWCRETLGEPGNNRRYHWRASWSQMADNPWYNGSNSKMPRIFLRREVDVTLFTLKWCN